MEGKGGREAATEGQAGGGRSGQTRASGLATRGAGLAAGLLFGSAAPRSVARQALPRQLSAFPVVAMSAPRRATMHGVAQAFGRAMAIDAAKSVSFKEKNKQC